MTSPSSKPALSIGATTPDVAQAFMDVEWPPHDEGLGIRWRPVEVFLSADEGEARVGVACFTANGGVCELKQILVAMYARPFYERFGFRSVCTLVDDRFHRDWYVMEKLLSG